MSIVEFFADSHGGKFGGNPLFALKDAQQATAYNLAKGTSNGWQFLQHYLHEYNPDNIFALGLGEIDCRCHVYRQAILQQREYSEIIADIIARYGNVIWHIKNDVPRKVAVFDVIPACRQENVYGLDYYGTRTQRAEIIREFNSQLGAFCEKNDIPFIELYPILATKKGFLKERYAADDDVHATSECVPFAVGQLLFCFPELCV